MVPVPLGLPLVAGGSFVGEEVPELDAGGGTSRATVSCSDSPAIASFKAENECSFFRIFTFCS